MFRLNHSRALAFCYVSQFQYIQCFGWTCHQDVYIYNPDRFQYIQCFGWTDIYLITQNLSLIFQYIQCFGWTKHKTLGKRAGVRFQYIQCFGWTSLGAMIYLPLLSHFNTSNVSVEQNKITRIPVQIHYFNTSNVSVELPYYQAY